MTATSTAVRTEDAAAGGALPETISGGHLDEGIKVIDVRH